MEPSFQTSPASPTPVEITLWKGHPSHWVHFWFYFFCLILAAGAVAGIPFTLGYSAIALALPVTLWLIRWAATRSTVYELTSQRLKVRRGILNRRLDELELYRVKDYIMEQPFLLRLVGRGNLTLVTSDASSQTLLLHAIPAVENVRKSVRSAVQSERDRKRVREIDLDSIEPQFGT